MERWWNLEVSLLVTFDGRWVPHRVRDRCSDRLLERPWASARRTVGRAGVISDKRAEAADERSVSAWSSASSPAGSSIHPWRGL